MFRHTRMERILVPLILICLLIIPASYAAKIVELHIKGPIGPATADYVSRGIAKAAHADLILITLDTPGGLEMSTRSITEQILTSNVPVVAYVSPTGARAASAGTYILYASTIAAMAPGTQLGAASPVNLGLGESNKMEKNSTIDKKATNDAVAAIRALAELRNRDPIFAQNAVLNASTITVNEALKEGVINYIAKDEMDLLAQLNGKTVMQNHKNSTLNTEKPEIEIILPDWRTEFLSIITQPTVAYLLILLGIYGIFFELVNPGYVLPGVVGTVAILLALYALQLMPISYAGLGLILFGVILIIAEGHAPSFGVLAVGGTISFILGSIMLMDTENAAFKISWSTIWLMAVVNLLIFIVILGVVFKARRQPVKNSLDLLVGAHGRALGEINLEGQAVIRGEIWRVQSKYPIAADRKIRVIQVTGLTLDVEEDYS